MLCYQRVAADKQRFPIQLYYRRVVAVKTALEEGCQRVAAVEQRLLGHKGGSRAIDRLRKVSGSRSGITSFEREAALKQKTRTLTVRQII